MVIQLRKIHYKAALSKCAFVLCSFFLIGQKTIMIYNPESTLKANYNLECLMRVLALVKNTKLPKQCKQASNFKIEKKMNKTYL